MRRLLVTVQTLLFFTLPLKSVSANSMLHCGQLGQISNHMSNPRNASRFLKEAANNDEINLVVLGETHYKHYFFQFYDLLEALNLTNQPNTCFFGEISENMTTQDLEQAVRGEYNDIFFSRTRLNFAHLFKKFIDKNWKVIPVDKHMSPQEIVAPGKPMTWYSERDDIMLRNIESAYRGGDCSFGILLVGRLHITSRPNYRSLGKRIKESEVLKSKTIETIDPGHLSLTCSGWELHSFSSFITSIQDFNTSFTKTQNDVSSDADYKLFLNPIHSPKLLNKPINPDNPFWKPSQD